MLNQPCLTPPARRLTLRADATRAGQIEYEVTRFCPASANTDQVGHSGGDRKVNTRLFAAYAAIIRSNIAGDLV